MQQAALQFEKVPVKPAPQPQLRLLVDWTPFWPQLRQNLSDTLRGNPVDDINERSPKGAFWPDVFVDRPPVWERIVPSAFIHALTISFVFGSSFWVNREARLIYPETHKTISYYDVSDYLPPVKSEAAPTPARAARKGQPALAKQEIISVPPAPDNSTQTIVNPPHPSVIAQEVPLPNMSVWTAPSPQPPTMSLSRAKLELPQTLVKPIEAPPDVRRLHRQATNLPQPSVVEPPVDPNALKLKAGQFTIAQVNPAIEIPALPMPQQRANAPVPSPDTSQDVPPPPSTTGLSGGRQASGQLVALNLRPTPPQGDIQVPNGSRSGIFAAGPTGTVGAPGTPNFPEPNGAAPTGGKGDGRAASPGGSGKTGDGLGASGVPNGISITGGTTPPKTGAVVAATPSRPNLDAPSREVAANRPPAEIVRPAQPPINPEKKIEEQVFGPRKYYSMQIQMANFTSVGSSWVIRFAEMDNAPMAAGELETPDAIKKVDPAYPPDLIRDQIGGTVALYAVIHADGTVGDVRVLRGFNDRLDENAKKALLKWQFRPAKKNGAPIEMQAVVYIPFNPPARRVF